ncbi:DUF6531 domain-containing protein [Vibrio splendidus]
MTIRVLVLTLLSFTTFSALVYAGDGKKTTGGCHISKFDFDCYRNHEHCATPAHIAFAKAGGKHPPEILVSCPIAKKTTMAINQISDTETGEQNCNIMTSHPVNILSGNKYYPVTDYIGTGNSEIKFKRFYNSLTGRWSISYSRNIDRNNNRFFTDSGRIMPIVGNIIIGYGYLDRNTLYRNDGHVEYYNAYGRLDSITSLNGRRIKITYSGVVFKDHKQTDEVVIYDNDYYNETEHGYEQLVGVLKYKYTPLASKRTGDFWTHGTKITVRDEFSNQLKIVIAHDLDKPQLYLKDGFLGYPISWESSDGLSALFYYNNFKFVDNYDNRDGNGPLEVVNYFDDFLTSTTKKHIKNIKYEYDNLLLNGKISYITKVIENGKEVSNVKYYENGKVKHSSITGGIESSDFIYDIDKTTVTNSAGKQTIYKFKDGNVMTVEGVASPNCLSSGTEYFYHKKYGKSGNSLQGSKRTDGTFSLTRKDELGRTVCILEGGGTREQRYITFDWYDKPSRIRKKVNGSYGIEYSYTGPLLLLSNVKKFTVEQGRSSPEQYSLCED